ncbi:MAG TPA: hypothetical protein VGX78_05740 [Pirellulales bacterium]|nr:hypothetical protein [Pirellulales bacterium]
MAASRSPTPWPTAGAGRSRSSISAPSLFGRPSTANRRTELYGELRKALEPKRRLRQLLSVPAAQWTRKQRCVSLPPDDGRLREELAVLPKRYDGEGRLRLPSKSRIGARSGERREPTIRELLGGRSPDRADALVLAYYAWEDNRETRSLMRVNRPLIW